MKVAPSANAYERLGWCYFRLSDYGRSLNAYREAVKIDPNHWQSHNGIGVNAINTWLLSKKRDVAAGDEARDRGSGQLTEGRREREVAERPVVAARGTPASDE